MLCNTEDMLKLAILAQMRKRDEQECPASVSFQREKKRRAKYRITIAEAAYDVGQCPGEQIVWFRLG